MDKKNKNYIKDLVYYSTLGLQVVFSIIIGFFIGKFLDGIFSTSPWLTLIFLIFGIAAAYRNIGLAIKKIKKSEEL